MPEYGFECSKCEHQFNKACKMSDRKKPLSKPCPSCQEEGTVFRVYEIHSFVDPGILNADKNLERSGVLKELNRLQKHHPYMKWKG